MGGEDMTDINLDSLIPSLNEELDYDTDAGVLTWKKARSNVPAGSQAGCFDKSGGYRFVTVFGHHLLEHRVIYAMMTGQFPKGQMDHINRDRSDNRWCNLRLATHSENCMNKVKQSNNTSGYKGVTFHKATKKYHAKITHNKKTISLGYFADPISASLAYQNAAKDYHHDFARS